MNRFYPEPCRPEQLSPLALAFVGDCVFDLFVRERLVCKANRPVRHLHALAAKQVNAAAQSNAVKAISPHLTEEEAAVLRRGRNAHTRHKAKNATEADYHSATALESLIGYLYLKGNIDRIRELMDIILTDSTEEKYEF